MLSKFTTEARSLNYVCRGKTVSITHSECVSVSSSSMQSACAILLSLSCPALQYFSTLSHKWHDFRGKKSYWTQKVFFWFSLQLLSGTFLILRRIQREIITNVQRSSCKVPNILVRC